MLFSCQDFLFMRCLIRIYSELFQKKSERKPIFIFFLHLVFARLKLIEKKVLFRYKTTKSLERRENVEDINFLSKMCNGQEKNIEQQIEL